MLKYLFLYLILVTNLFSSNSEVMIDKEMKNIIDSLPSMPNQTILQGAGFDDVNKNTLSKKEILKNEYKKFQFAIEQMNDDSFKKIAIDNLNEALYKLDNNEEIIIFYFISADTNEENIRSFMNYIDVLNSHFPSIKGKILLNNYPENLVDEVNRKLDFLVEPFEKDSGKGIIKVYGDGSYTYKVKSINGMKPNEKYQDIFHYVKKDGSTGNIILELKVDRNTKLKIIGETIVDSMVPYLKNLREKNIASNNVKFHIHPWAFNALKLSVVPAYVFSFCNSENFRFRDCENKYIVKGNITLDFFIKLIADKNSDYNKYYKSLQEGLNVKK